MDKQLKQLRTSKGTPHPLGQSLKEEDINFAIRAPHATSVSLCLFERETEKPLAEIPLVPEINKTEDIWHIAIPNQGMDILYAYRIFPPLNAKQQLLLDPYAKCVFSSHEWGKVKKVGSPYPYHPLGEVLGESTFDWGDDSPPHIPLNDLIIYEMSVRAFTKHPSSHVHHPGTFLGIIEKIPYLLELGVNAIELLPVQEFNEQECLQKNPHTKSHLYNAWGYSTVNFFAPMNRYATSSEKGAASHEFKTMVKQLHQHGIEIILDVVFNHTAEGNTEGPILSFKGIDNAVYYLLDANGNYLNYSGCGNTLNVNNPPVLEMIVRCLSYWVTEMHVDGFRFDLASVLKRGTDGNPLDRAPLIEAITKDPILSNVKLIAEPWDAAGLYHVGNFASDTNRWSEWNDKYRDGVRRFIKGTPWSSGEFAARLCGSEDLYPKRSPCSSINFITSHDGFSLADLVSYNSKHNSENGEENRDGSNHNTSWNCGFEGPTTNHKVLTLREKQMKNFHLALMLSQGIPMLTMGDEYCHTKKGNNNTWCQDNDLNWFQWDQLKSKASFYRFYRLLIAFRKKHPILRRLAFLTPIDINWHGVEPFQPDWNSDKRFLAFTLKDHHDDRDLFIAFNAQDHIQLIHLPPPPYAKRWHWVVNTANHSPSDVFENEEGPIQHESSYRIAAYSAIVLEAC